MDRTRVANHATTGLAQLALKTSNIEKFLYLSTLRKNNVHLFYRLMTDHLKVCSDPTTKTRLACGEDLSLDPHHAVGGMID